MNVINVMNFVRACDERDEYVNENLINITKKELALVNEFQVENTFLLQYDALCDERFVNLFKSEATEKTELGIWLEIVEPMTSACGLPYRSENGWKWDWHIIPGLPMGYTSKEREMLIDETMLKFKSTFGYYPKTVGGWLIDTHTMNYLYKNYEIDAICICRDQVSTDAYTLIGGYFNGAYYPSTENIFTPAQSPEYQVNIPIFRLLGACPVFNYDKAKFLPKDFFKNESHGGRVTYTLEPAWPLGTNEKAVDWFFKVYLENENMGFSAVQIGQENSFADVDFLPALRMQLEKAVELVKSGKAEFRKYCDTGRYFKENYKRTPVTTITATDTWTECALQSVYYNCKNYVANIYRNGRTIFLRSLYLFDERVKDKYISKPCTTFYSIYENLPIIDTVLWQKGNVDNVGMIFDNDGCEFVACTSNNQQLIISWGDKSVVFSEDEITINNCGEIHFSYGEASANIKVSDNIVMYNYNDCNYSLTTENCNIIEVDNGIIICGDKIILKPKKQ